MGTRDRSILRYRLLQTGVHPLALVDPFGRFPCPCDSVLVHISNGRRGIADDLVECPRCQIVVSFAELYAGLMPPGGLPIPAP